MPQALHLDVQGAAVEGAKPDTALLCAFCTRPGALRGHSGKPASCPLCWLVRDLGRPRIDEEARLIWLPEADQRVINILCREIHIQLYDLKEPLNDEAVPRMVTEASTRLYYARAALAGREDAAASRLGSSKASELAEALRQLPAVTRARQADLLAGMRLLPRGRFFDGDVDIYPAIVSTWAAATTEGRNPRTGVSA